MKRTEESKIEFIKRNFITCDTCGYNNERSRFLQYGTCLKCGKILDKKTHFMIEMMKRIRNNERKSR